VLTLTLSPNVPKCAFVDPRHLGAPLDVSKMISKSLVCLAQTMDLSCAETNTISKRTEQASTWHTLPRSTIGCVQSDFHARRLFRHKPCTYLAPRLKLSPNGSKWASAWSTSPTSTVRCVQNDLWAYGTFGKTMYLSCVEINTISKWAKTSFYMTHVTLEYHRLRPK
jgi:hypothetical protein